MNKPENVYAPITFEIHADKSGNPYLKTVYRRRNVDVEGRGKWVNIGRVTDTNIDRVVKINQRYGIICLPDDQGVIRALVLTD